MLKFGVAFTIGCIACSTNGIVAQIITGRVLEIDSDRPVPAALIALMEGERSLLTAESDSAGYFRMAVPRAGWYRLRVERLGYATSISDSVDVNDRENVEVAIRLGVTAVPLDPLLIIERRRATRPASEFERRLESGQRTGLGVFITRAALDSTTAQSVTAVLGRVALLGGGGLASLSRGGCTPTLYLNGARFQLAPGETIDDLIQPQTLEGIEIYRHRTELPREFAGIGHCAAIIFWTRTGDTDRRAGWRFLAAGGALFGLLLLFLTN